MTVEERAVTPSAQTDVIKVTATKIAEGKASLELAENLNYAFGDDGGLSDWNDAKLYIVRKCDSEKESQVGTTYSNDVDPITKKRRVFIPSISLCAGNMLMIRIRVEAAGGGGMREMRFPFEERVIRTPSSLQLVREPYKDLGLIDLYYTYLRGSL